MKHVFRIAGLSSLLLMALVACPEPTKPPVQTAPQIVSFTASNSSLTAAGTVKLEWSVQNASSLSISPGVGVVTGSSTTVNVAVTTTFELTAQNSAGSDKKSVLVTLQSPLFDPSNAWKVPVPINAKQITPEEYQRRVEAGELLPINDTTRAAQENAVEQQFQTDLSVLRGVQNPSESVQKLLASSVRTDSEISLPNGEKVVLLGGRSTARALAKSVQQSQDVGNALRVYSSLYEPLPDALKSQVPEPSSLQGQPLDVVETALTNLNDLLSQEAVLDGTGLEPIAPTNGVIRPQTMIAGNGRDNDLGTPNCRTPSGLVTQYRFPLKKFISPIKDQATRGLCWAFSAIGAIESRERVQNNNVVDLSEQFLAYKVKAEWSRDDFGDGFSAETALDMASAFLQPIPNESYWTYNRAEGRVMGNDAFTNYAKSCDWIPGGTYEYTGTCSDSAHQAKGVCTQITLPGVPDPLPYCAIELDQSPVTGTFASSSSTAWSSGQVFNLASYIWLMASGHTLIGTFPIYKGFGAIGADGYLTDKRRVIDAPNPMNPAQTIEVNGSRGDHVVQIVGFIPNAAFYPVRDIPGGGYFIIKNSWGCDFGDGGYAYMDAQYVADVFYNLSYLNFDNRRSAAWTTEQAAVQAPAPIITAKTAPRQVDVRVPTDLGSLFSLSHENPGVSALNVTVRLGTTTLYNGLTSIKSLLPLELPYTFSSAGNQILQVTARYGTQSTTQNIDFTVVNTAPQAKFTFPSPIYTYSSSLPTPEFSLRIVDKNEANPQTLCPNMRWEVDLPNLIESNTIANTVTGGCSQKIRFAGTGNHEVRVSITDSDGLSGSSSVNVLVQDPPVNPYPVILGGGVQRWDIRNNTGFCIKDAVNRTTLDLRSIAPSTNCDGLPNPTTFFAYVNVQNPDNDALEYAWQLTLITPSGEYTGTAFLGMTSTEEKFAIPQVSYGVGGMYPCNVKVRIRAYYDPIRVRNQTIWSGQCQVAAVVPR